jgi:alpha-tubulin suppressor-like RCC1 family protein
MNKTLKIVNGLSNIIKIVNGINHFVALDLNGNVFAWGNNKRGCLGN